MIWILRLALAFSLLIVLNGKRKSRSLSEHIIDNGNFIRDFRDILIQNPKYIPIHIAEDYYNLIGPDVMFNVLEESFCHDRGHNIGRVVYQHTGKSLLGSLEICGHRCTGACFHGALMQYFDDLKANLTAKNGGLEHLADAVLQPYFNMMCEGNEVAGSSESLHDIANYYKQKDDSGDCFHGLGHAAMSLSEYDPFRAISICKLLSQKLHAYYCATGAYHEYYLQNYGQRVGDSLLYPCDKTNDFPAACYRTCFLYKPYFRDKGFLPLSQICSTMADDRQRQGCFHGFGLLMYHFVVYNHVPAEKVCSSAASESSAMHMCIEGIAGVMDQFLKQKKQPFCDAISEPDLRTLCNQAGNQKMNKIPELYFSVGNVTKNSNSIELDFRLLSIYNHLLSVEDIEEYYSRIGPNVILHVLEAESKCHNKAISVGRVVRRHSRDLVESIAICRARCSGGCFNGAILEHFLQLAANNDNMDLHHFSTGVGSYFNSFCQNVSLWSQIRLILNATTVDCYYSLGNVAVSLSSYNTSLAASICATLDDRIAAYHCATGVFHAYFAVPRLGVTTIGTPFHPCDARNDFPAACYRAYFSSKPPAPDAVAQACHQMTDAQQRLGCFNAYGLVAHRLVASPTSPPLDSLCRSAGCMGDGEMRACVEGAAGAINSYSPREVRQRVCGAVSDSALRSACAEARDMKMNKDPALYFSVGPLGATAVGRSLPSLPS